jgi:hypothetical protein
MKRNETIPRKDEDFYEFQFNLMLIFLANAVGWKFDMDWITNILAPARIEYETAYQAWRNPNTRTTEIKTRKKEARRVYELLLRQLVEMIKSSPYVPTESKEAMQIALGKSGGNQRNPKPTDPPSVRIATELLRFLIIYFGIIGEALLGHALRGKPHGVHGAEIVWAILPEPPKEVSELIHSAFCTASPFRLEFKESDRGKTVYICVRWENTTGEKGPWTAILSAIIP